MMKLSTGQLSQGEPSISSTLKVLYSDYKAVCDLYASGDPGPRISRSNVEQWMRRAHKDGGYDTPKYRTSEDVPVPKYIWRYLDSDSLGLSIRVPTHPHAPQSIITSLQWVFRVAKPCVKDKKALILETDEHLLTPEMQRRLRLHIANGSYTYIKKAEQASRFSPASVLKPELSELSHLVHTDQWIQVQDSLSRDRDTKEIVSDEDAHHREVTIKHHVSMAPDPATIWNALDINPHGNGDTPPYIAALSDDRAALAFLFTEQSIPANITKLAGWELVSQRFFLTEMHHDANGVATWIYTQAGGKLWFYLEWDISNPRKEHWDHRMRCLANQDVISICYETTPPWYADGLVNEEIYEQNKADWESRRVSSWYCIEAIPGSCIIQAPGSIHMVYNEQTSWTSGGHFMLYDSMPLTQLHARMDHLSGEKTVTNDDHPSITLIQSAMLLRLVGRNRKPGEGTTAPYWSRSEDAIVRALYRLVRFPKAHTNAWSEGSHGYRSLPQCETVLNFIEDVLFGGHAPLIVERSIFTGSEQDGEGSKDGDGSEESKDGEGSKEAEGDTLWAFQAVDSDLLAEGSRLDAATRISQRFGH